MYYKNLLRKEEIQRFCRQQSSSVRDIQYVLFYTCHTHNTNKLRERRNNCYQQDEVRSVRVRLAMFKLLQPSRFLCTTVIMLIMSALSRYPHKATRNLMRKSEIKWGNCAGSKWAGDRSGRRQWAENGLIQMKLLVVGRHSAPAGTWPPSRLRSVCRA